ncbi:hypothetical protein OsI_09372 [Oryza sativa Indica Group]|uniref:Uncharacterized protein n=1 Tax=Oryza sativa subsp. indica TaxID=39946 RepID=B8AEG7_ORYSI|nr:hypothetical protein OsI_09372 [Oryza sativa Indica Group]
MAVSNNITACVTLMALICAVPVIASGVWFTLAQGEECARLARWPLAILGGLILLAALVGFVGAYWKSRRLLQEAGAPGRVPHRRPNLPVAPLAPLVYFFYFISFLS